MDFQEESKAGGLPRLHSLQNPGKFLPISFKSPEISRQSRLGLARAVPGSLETRSGHQKLMSGRPKITKNQIA